MRMTIAEALDMIQRGETPEQYEKRVKRLRRLSNERYDLEDAIAVLGDDPRADKKRRRLTKVLVMIEQLQ